MGFIDTLRDMPLWQKAGIIGGGGLALAFGVKALSGAGGGAGEDQGTTIPGAVVGNTTGGAASVSALASLQDAFEGLDGMFRASDAAQLSKFAALENAIKALPKEGPAGVPGPAGAPGAAGITTVTTVGAPSVAPVVNPKPTLIERFGQAVGITYHGYAARVTRTGAESGGLIPVALSLVNPGDSVWFNDRPNPYDPTGPKTKGIPFPGTGYLDTYGNIITADTGTPLGNVGGGLATLRTSQFA